MKKCPYCAEEIQEKALKCRHCGEFLDSLPVSKEKVKDKSVKYEYSTIKVYNGLGLYTTYLPYFGWEIIGNQKINYSSNTTSSGSDSGRMGFFDKKSYSGSSNLKSKTVHYYYNELSLKRVIGETSQDLLDIENLYFKHINNSLITTSYSYINMFTVISIIIGIIFIKIADGSISSMLFMFSSIFIIIGIYKNYKIKKRHIKEKPILDKKYSSIIYKHGFEGSNVKDKYKDNIIGNGKLEIIFGIILIILMPISALIYNSHNSHNGNKYDIAIENIIKDKKDNLNNLFSSFNKEGITEKTLSLYSELTIDQIQELLNNKDNISDFIEITKGVFLITESEKIITNDEFQIHSIQNGKILIRAIYAQQYLSLKSIFEEKNKSTKYSYSEIIELQNNVKLQTSNLEKIIKTLNEGRNNGLMQYIKIIKNNKTSKISETKIYIKIENGKIYIKYIKKISKK